MLSECILLSNDTWTPWDGVQKPEEYRLKIYHDGGHYVGTLLSRCTSNKTKRNHSKTTKDMLFDNLYFNALKDDLKGESLTTYILNGLLRLFPYDSDMEGYIVKMIERKISNLYKRKKRFYRKANLNPWNYFVTITYNPILHTDDSFRRKLRKGLSNLHTRRGWKYMGVFEHAPESGRLHFHGIFYVPDGEMIGKINEISDYDTRKNKRQTTFSNSFFAENFGRNDFKELNQAEFKNGYSLRYLTKYISKTNERLVYSRGVPTVIYKYVNTADIASEFFDFVNKFVLFDDVIDWERDVGKKRRKQMSMIDILCNPPNIN